MDVQLAAPFVVLNIPADVPAYKVVGEAGATERALTMIGAAPSRPPLAVAQLWPPSVLLKMPASVPA